MRYSGVWCRVVWYVQQKTADLINNAEDVTTPYLIVSRCSLKTPTEINRIWKDGMQTQNNIRTADESDVHYSEVSLVRGMRAYSGSTSL